MKRRLASVVRMRAPRRGAVLLASLVVAAAFAGSPSLAGSVHVWRVGTYRGISGQFRTIQAAVDAARPGDWILVAPGDYHENGSSDSEADHESPLANRRVGRDVGDLVDPQDSGHEEAEGERQDDRRRIERPRQDKIRP